uniref:Uncharacterized protein n=1 Tax=Arundo donax TaxID=35708 RepID=A0A0A8ZVU5_ARUDO
MALLRTTVLKAGSLANPTRATGGHTAPRRSSARIGRGKFQVAAISR